MKFVRCMRDMWVVQCYCTFEPLVEMCEVVGMELYWKLIAKMVGVVCEVVARTKRKNRWTCALELSPLFLVFPPFDFQNGRGLIRV